MKTEKILGFKVCTEKEDIIIKNIWQDFENNIQNSIVNVNPEIIINNYKNSSFVEKMNMAKFQIPDGVGVIWALKKMGYNVEKRITGIDLMAKICEDSVKYKAQIFLYGSKEDTVKKAQIELENKYKGINIVGVCDGYQDEEIVLEKIKKSDANILFIGTGSPKQENFIFKYKEKLKNIKIFMPIGGSLDVISNNIKRAPNWIKKCNLEWLYRLIKEPKRFFRQLKLITFVRVVKKEAKKERKKIK